MGKTISFTPSLLTFFMSIVGIVAKNLLNVYYFRTGIPSDATTHEIPFFLSFVGTFFMLGKAEIGIVIDLPS